MSDELPCILFVDDEPPVLDGLRRKMFGQSDRWTMIFATSGNQALEFMTERVADVVVSDMRMPGMDGAQLLDTIRHLYPATARFILSGYAEREALFRTIGPAHQYFTKPSDSESLVRAIERALAIRKRLHSPDLLALISGATGLPALPQAFTELFEQFQSPNGSVAEVSRIICSDVGLTAQLLKLVNSAYFFLPTKVMDVRQAVRMLGFDLVRSLTLLAGVFRAVASEGVDLPALERLSDRSLKIGAVARRIAIREGADAAMAEQSQCAGMLAHVGSLILFARRPQEMLAMQFELDRSGAGNLLSLEQQRFGASHPEIGSALLSLWGFGDALVEAVLYHHTPAAAASDGGQTIGLTTLVHAAQALVRPGAAGGSLADAQKGGIDMDYVRRVGAVDRISVWAGEVAGAEKES